MSDVTHESLDLDEEDNLPWLESAEDYGEYEGSSPWRVGLLVLLGLFLIAAVVGGIYWYNNRDGAITGDGRLIPAQEGDYKVRPSDPQAKSFEGEGDASFAASEGQAQSTRLGSSENAEEAVKPAAPGSQSGQGGLSGKSALIQLGAYSSVGLADSAWAGFARRFSDIGDLPKKISEGSVEGGTVYRLNAVAPSVQKAQQICNALKAAGEGCIVGP